MELCDSLLGLAVCMYFLSVPLCTIYVVVLWADFKNSLLFTLEK